MVDESARVVDSSVDEGAALYRNATVRRSAVPAGCVVADNADVIGCELDKHVRIGRRNLVLDSHIGFGTYTGSNTEIRNAVIGKMCNISWNCSLGGHNHNYRAACLTSVGPWDTVFGSGGGGCFPDEERPPLEIGSDVWVASSATVIEGVKVGHGCVIGAGAVVVRDLPPYSVAVGVPARVIKRRFDDWTVERLLELAWWDWDEAKIAGAAPLLLRDLDEATLAELEGYGRAH